MAMDAIALVENDHREVERLFEQFKQTAGDAQRRGELAQQIVRELSVHAGVEEVLLYPLIRAEVERGGKLTEHALDEHQDIKELAARVERAQAGTDEFDQAVRALEESVSHHVEEEERDVLPALRAATDPQLLADVGAAMDAAKSVAPTHPHPRGPETLPGHLVVDPIAAVVDKARDLAGGLFNR